MQPEKLRKTPQRGTQVNEHIYEGRMPLFAFLMNKKGDNNM